MISIPDVHQPYPASAAAPRLLTVRRYRFPKPIENWPPDGAKWGSCASAAMFLRPLIDVLMYRRGPVAQNAIAHSAKRLVLSVFCIHLTAGPASQQLNIAPHLAAKMAEAGTGPASWLQSSTHGAIAITLADGLTRRPSQAQIRANRKAAAAISVLVVVTVIFIIVLVVLIDADAPVIGPANSGSDCSGVATGSNYRDGRDLRNEDEVALGIGRHRV